MFLQKNPFPVTCTTVAYVCHITDIFIIIELSQKLFDIEFLYKYCKVIPPHQLYSIHQGVLNIVKVLNFTP